MARRTEPSCRLCRREGDKLFLKGERCTSSKCAIVKREYGPGQHGQLRKRKPSDFAIQLREKQKAKRIYGMFERQFRNYFERAERAKGATGEVLIQLLERRLDNVIFRSCFASSLAAARQIVGHKFVRVNGRKVNIPSYQVKEGDAIKLAGTEAQIKALKERAKALESRGIPDWLEVSIDDLSLKIKRLPTKNDSGKDIQESLIVELYSK
jgi:small subunit ribosomal protein S4